MIKNLLICFFVLLGIQSGIAQNITAKIIDAKSGESLSFANIQINKGESVISNSEGYFTILQKDSSDDILLSVSFLGYKSEDVTIRELKNNNLVVKLQPGAFELETLYISNGKMNADSIMAAVKKNLAHNYRKSGEPLKRMLFYREANAFKPIKLNVEMTESTGYKKDQIKAANKGFKAFTNKLTTHPPQEFTDMLCNYYTAKKMVDGKPFVQGKFEVIKAVKMKDKKRSVDVDELQKMAAGILFQHLDSTKYYRLKSGLFGTRDTVLSGKDFGNKKDKAKTKKSELNSAKSSVMTFMSANNLQSSKFDFVVKHELYEYTYAGAIQSDNNEFVYIIKFKPRKRKAKYTGTLYVSEKDYAVVRADYALSEGKTLGGVNLKFLLGIKQSENISKGTLIFKEKADSGYYLQYASMETGQYMYINRPLKFIEITEGEKDKVAFDLKIEANVLDKEEYFLVSQSDITEGIYDNVNEAEFNYIHLENYDPNIWKEYTTIEPLEEMKQFKVEE